MDDSFSPGWALAAYAEPLVAGARVAVLGDASTGLADVLVERGARLVHVYDPDRGRALEAAAKGAARGVAFAPLPDDGDLGVRDGAFDAVLVPDLSLATAPAAWIALARRILSPAGTALVATPNAASREPEPGRSAFGYYELYDAAALQFRVVRMAAQLPFAAQAIADLAPDGEPEISVDGSFAGESPEPTWFVAVAGERRPRLDAYLLVQQPLRDEEPASRVVDDGAAVAAAIRVEELTAERDHARHEARAADERARDERQRAERAESELRARVEELALALARAESVSAELVREQDRRAARDRAVEALAAEKRRLAEDVEAQAALVRELRATCERLEAATRAPRSDAEVERLRAELSAAAAEREAEVARYEANLATVAERTEQLEHDLRDTERTGRELVLELERSRKSAPEPDGDLRAKLDRLAALAATREADLAAARWTIADLERRVRRG